MPANRQASEARRRTYLENNLTPGSFTPDRVAILQLLASQAAISLENATLFTDLQRSEAFLAQGQKISHTGSFGRNVLSEKLYWSEETYEIYELDRSVEPTLGFLIQRIHPEDRVRVQQAIESAIHQRTGFDIEYRLLTSGGSVDTGIGLPLQFAGRIFDPFYTTKPQGAGMGLRICRSIIESHGGHLWAEGATGCGATFHVSLPATIPWDA